MGAKGLVALLLCALTLPLAAADISTKVSVLLEHRYRTVLKMLQLPTDFHQRCGQHLRG